MADGGFLYRAGDVAGAIGEPGSAHVPVRAFIDCQGRIAEQGNEPLPDPGSHAAAVQEDECPPFRIVHDPSFSRIRESDFSMRRESSAHSGPSRAALIFLAMRAYIERR